jgi:drug/metabolite transporter (DMT)-like permease
MAVGLAVFAAFFLGSGSYVGGHAVRADGRPQAALPIAWVGSVVGVGIAVVAVAIVRPSAVAASDLLWGIAAGACIGTGRALLYQGLGRGPIVVFAPISALTSVVVPVIVGAFIGQGLALLEGAGIAVALPAVVLLASGTRLPKLAEVMGSKIVGLAVVDGVVFGFASVFLGQTSEDAGISIALITVGAAAVLMPTVRIVGVPFPRPVRHAIWLAVGVGVIEIFGEFSIVLAFQRGPIAVVAAIVGLTPAITMVWAKAVDREPIFRLQIPGAVLGVLSVLLFAIA